MTDQPITYNPRAWATYSRDAKCGCTAPDPADCAIPHQPGPWMCPCHYLSTPPTAEELAAVRSKPAPERPTEMLEAKAARLEGEQGKPPAARAWPAISGYLDECHAQIIELTKDRERAVAAEARIQAITEATVMWRDRPGGDVGLAIALAGILDTEKPEPPAATALVRVLSECDRIEREVYGQHDEDDDGMREAVRRIRAAATEPLTRTAIDGAGVTS